MSSPRTAKTARRPAVAVPPMGKRAGHAKAAERQATAKRAGEAPNGGSAQAKRLAELFRKNFEQFTDRVHGAVGEAGPQA